MSLRNARLHRPAVPEDFLVRPRLERALERGRRHPLTLIVAPAGFGKSCLASGCFEHRPEPSAWLGLEAGDDDLLPFWECLLAAIRSCYADACPESASAIARGQLPEVALFSEELGRLPAAPTLVIDDFHVVRDPRIHALLGDLLRRPDPGVRLVLLARRDPPLDLSGLRLSGRLVELRQRDLEFTAEEAGQLLESSLGVAIDEAAVGRIQEGVEGWPAALRLVLLACADVRSIDQVLERLPQGLHQASEFLSQEVFAGESEAVQAYLPCLLGVGEVQRNPLRGRARRGDRGRYLVLGSCAGRGALRGRTR